MCSISHQKVLIFLLTAQLYLTCAVGGTSSSTEDDNPHEAFARDNATNTQEARIGFQAQKKSKSSKDNDIAPIEMQTAFPKYLKAKESPIPGRYILILNDMIEEEEVDDLSEELCKWKNGVMIGKAFRRSLKGFAAYFSEADAMALSLMEYVDFVEEDSIVTKYIVWGLDRIDQRNLPLDGAYIPGGDGTGVSVYIVDTGIMINHNEFDGRATWGVNFVDSNDSDCDGHGTHVAGTVGGSTYGVAKNVQLVAVKVLDCKGSGSHSNVIKGIEWIVTDAIDKKKPSVANMSLGGGLSQAVNNAVNNAVARGITFVAAAGNSNKDACKYSPGSATSAITVGATSITDARSSYSNYGKCVDIFSPGSGITSAWIGSNDATTTLSGTSMSSPHTAGVAAIFLGQDTNQPHQAIWNKIKSSASSNTVSDPGVDSPSLLLYVSNHAMPPTPTPAPPTAPPPQGEQGAFLETWVNIPYATGDNTDRLSIDSLTRLPAYPNNPDAIDILANVLEAPSNRGDDYGSKISTYIVAPASGAYHFYIASDDSGQLWLSPNASPGDAVMIAFIDGGWANPREWTKYSSQKSAAITLVQGQVYYLEAIMKEAAGEDNLAVGWESLENNISLDVISADYTILEPPNGPPPPTPTPAPPTAPPPQGEQGAFLETWVNIPYATGDNTDRLSIDSLTRLPAYPNNPDAIDILANVLEAPSNRGDDYGSKISTYIVAPASGAYHFYIASDDSGQLWLSPNINPVNAAMIAFIDGGWTHPREWTKYSSQKSDAITLVQGQVYYLEAIMKEAAGEDNLAVGWESLENNISLDVISADYTILEPPNGPPPPTPTPAPPTAPPPQGEQGAFLETWVNIPYATGDNTDRLSIDSLTRLPAYPNNPDAIDILTNVLEAPSNRGDDYGSKISTYIVAPASGAYHFYIASDNSGQLWLSPNASPGDAAMIAFIDGVWANPRQWTKYSSQKSAAITLVQGQVYYLEAIMKEADAGDNLAVGWESLENNISLDVISADYTILEPPNGPPPPTPTPAPPTAPPPQGEQGAFLETWVNIPYATGDNADRLSIDSLTRLPAYPNNPDAIDILANVLEAPSNRGDDYGSKISTYIVAPASGAYHFYIASDNSGQLWLSPNTSPGDAVMIARIDGGWTHPREWTKYSSQKSSSINLVQGQVYYLEAIMKEADAGDNLAVGWESLENNMSLDVIRTDFTVLEPP